MRPSVDQWLAEAKAAPGAENCGMYLTHCGTVRQSARAKVRLGEAETRSVIGMRFSYDAEKVAAAVRETEALEGIFHVRVWLSEGELRLGDDIMQVPHVVDALQFLVGRIKSECVREEEIFA